MPEEGECELECALLFDGPHGPLWEACLSLPACLTGLSKYLLDAVDASPTLPVSHSTCPLAAQLQRQPACFCEIPDTSVRAEPRPGGLGFGCCARTGWETGHTPCHLRACFLVISWR